MKTTTQRKTWLFLCIAALFLFQDKLQDWFPVFTYYDELFALSAVPLFLMRLYQKKNPLQPTRDNKLFLIFLGIFWVFGWMGHFIYHYQPLTAAAKDAFVNVKFFLSVAAAFLLFEGDRFDYTEFKKKLWPVLNTVTAILFLLCVCDLIFQIFPGGTRGGMRTVKLYYSAYTVLVGLCVLLSSIYLWFYDTQKTRIILPLLMLSFVMAMTGRVKAVGVVACILMVYLLVLRRHQKLSRKMKVFAGCVLCISGVIALFQLIFYYYSMGLQSARAVLTVAAPFLAKDHFPFGTGWATFGSAFSAEPYSPIYEIYQLRLVWGLSPGNHEFISDTYWPMLMGQCGFIGFFAFLAAMFLFCKKVFALRSNSVIFASALIPMLYLFISSTSETAFANPIAVPLGFWLGLLFAQFTAEFATRERLQ